MIDYFIRLCHAAIVPVAFSVFWTVSKLLKKWKKLKKCKKKRTLSAGFEPTRGDPIGFQVQRLNHSAKTACREMAYVNLYLKICKF